MNDLKNQEIQYVRLLYKVIVNLLLFSKDNAATATTWALVKAIENKPYLIEELKRLKTERFKPANGEAEYEKQMEN